MKPLTPQELRAYALRVLELAAEILDKTDAFYSNGACWAVVRAADRLIPNIPRRWQTTDAIGRLMADYYEKDAMFRSPHSGYWGLAFGAHRDWRARKEMFNSLWYLQDDERSKTGRVLMLCFLAEMVRTRSVEVA